MIIILYYAAVAPTDMKLVYGGGEGEEKIGFFLVTHKTQRRLDRNLLAIGFVESEEVDPP